MEINFFRNLTNVWRKATPIKMVEAVNTADWLLWSQCRKIKMNTPIQHQLNEQISLYGELDEQNCPPVMSR